MSVFQILSIQNGNIWEQLQLWYANSLLRDFVLWLDAAFTLPFPGYDNFSVSPQAASTVRSVILGLLLGSIAASVLALYTRKVQGRFIRELLRRECFAPERALTLHEAGMFCSLAVRRELSQQGALARLTRCVEADGYDAQAAKKPFSPDFTTAHFYIPEDLKYRAELRYSRRGFGWPHLLAVVVLGLLAAFLLCRYLPALLGFADWLISALG